MCRLATVSLVAGVQGAEVALNRELAIHCGVLTAQVWLVEVVHMLHVGGSQTCRILQNIDHKNLSPLIYSAVKKLVYPIKKMLFFITIPTELTYMDL